MPNGITLRLSLTFENKYPPNRKIYTTRRFNKMLQNDFFRSKFTKLSEKHTHKVVWEKFAIVVYNISVQIIYSGAKSVAILFFSIWHCCKRCFKCFALCFGVISTVNIVLWLTSLNDYSSLSRWKCYSKTHALKFVGFFLSIYVFFL